MKKKIFNFLKYTLTKRGYSIQRIAKKKDTILLNVFKSDFKKKVLISYLIQPFTEAMKYDHTNYLECYTAAEIFHELGYVVDVVDLFDDITEINFDSYKIVYGLGYALEKAFYSKNPEAIIKISYSTGCNPFYSYKVSVLQVQNFYRTKGLLIPQSSRVIDYFWTFQYLLSDYVIALGNQYVSNTFLDFNPFIKCCHVNAFYFDVYDIDLEVKDFNKGRANFLWFGSSGLLHKGLDLLIDVFLQRDDITLHICGRTQGETKFWDYYQPRIEKCSNIINYGFTDINSENFKSLLDTCAFCIFPTVSEGGSPSILNVMANGGLIPLAPDACGVEISELGYLLPAINKESIIEVLDGLTLVSNNQLKEKSKLVKQFVRKEYTYDNYKKNMSRSIIAGIDSFQESRSLNL